MMLATPVRSRAWSSTSSTLAFSVATAASAGDMDLRREPRRLPGEHHFGAAAWRRDDCQRRADLVRALLHARHAEARTRLIPHDAAAVVGDRQAKADRLDCRSADGDAFRARVTHRVGECLLR